MVAQEIIWKQGIFIAIISKDEHYKNLPKLSIFDSTTLNHCLAIGQLQKFRICLS